MTCDAKVCDGHYVGIASRSAYEGDVSFLRIMAAVKQQVLNWLYSVLTSVCIHQVSGMRITDF